MTVQSLCGNGIIISDNCLAGYAVFYEKVFCALERNHVRYAVAGGVAVNLYGIPRMTADLDLVVDLESENLQRLLVTMQELGFRPRLPVAAEDLLSRDKRKDWIEKKNLHAFTFWNTSRPFEEVDVLLPESDDSDILEQAVKLQVDAMSIYLVSLEHLIKMKESAGRAQDRADLEALKKLRAMKEW